MFKRKNVLSIILAFALILSNAMVFAEELLPDAQADLMGGGLSIPQRNASTWALDELVDSDRYGLYKAEELYKNDLRNSLDENLKESLLKNFTEKLEETNLEAIEKPGFLAEIKGSNTRGNFLREVYNILVAYEDEENLGKDPIMYLNHTGIAEGNGIELFLDKKITAEEAILFTKRAVDYIYNENNLESEGLMWKVANKGNTVYLLGSIHYGEPDLYPLRDKILNNFSDSQTLYVEVDITNQEELMRIMVEKMAELEEELEISSKYQDGTTLESVIDKELYSKIETIMKKHDVAEEEYINLKIQGVEQKLNEIIIDDAFSDLTEEDEMDFDKAMEESMEELSEDDLMKVLIEGPKLGIDFYFLDKAKTLNKEVEELESIESQMDILFGGGLFGDLENVSEEEQAESLKIALESFDDEGNIIEIEVPEEQTEVDEELEAELDAMLEEQLDVIDQMFEAIKDGDAEKLSRTFTESGGAELLGAQLIGERDKEMAKKIAELLERKDQKTYFVVVGAAHFVVDGTVLDNLTDMGYEVERVK